MEPAEWPILAHADFGDPDCCGYLIPVGRGEQVDIVCNECTAILRTVPLLDIRATFDKMEGSLDVASEKCPHCGAVNLFPGFSRMLAFVCRECGKGVSLAG